MADLILVSTPHLASTFDDVREKVVCCPNLMDVDAYPKPPETLSVELPIRLIWAGGPTHKGDLEVIAGVVDRLLARFKDRISVGFFGATPPHPLLRNWLHKGLMYLPAVPYSQYQRTVNTTKPDVWLAPLADIGFNRSKSAIRVYEGWCLLGCPVASAVGEYHVVRPGTDGRLCHSEDSWVSAVSTLVEDHEMRLDMAVNGRQRVEREFNWAVPACRRPWVELFARLLDTSPPE
jgi:glycosyltransferase involved in cell wall biosynthesis